MTAFTLSRQAQTKNSTWGVLSSEGRDVAICKVLERGPSNPAHPRIPAGTYGITRKPIGASHFDSDYGKWVPNYGGILLLENVPGRSNIEIHCANVIQELLGCLALGETIGTDSDGDFYISKSRTAYAVAYPIISEAIDAGGAEIVITDPT